MREQYQTLDPQANGQDVCPPTLVFTVQEAYLGVGLCWIRRLSDIIVGLAHDTNQEGICYSEEQFRTNQFFVP